VDREKSVLFGTYRSVVDCDDPMSSDVGVTQGLVRQAEQVAILVDDPIHMACFFVIEMVQVQKRRFTYSEYDRSRSR